MTLSSIFFFKGWGLGSYKKEQRHSTFLLGITLHSDITVMADQRLWLTGGLKPIIYLCAHWPATCLPIARMHAAQSVASLMVIRRKQVDPTS